MGKHKRSISNKTLSIPLQTHELGQNKNNTLIKFETKTPSTIPRGRPKSGRIWKTEKEKFSSVIKTKGVRLSFQKKQYLRQELKRVKEASRAVLAARQEEKEAKKQKRRDNIKKQEENRKKSEVVQVITNTSKIKRMKKKHLRTIEKRDTLNM